MCALALPRRPPPPPLGGVACAPRVVPALGAGRAVPRGPCPSACPAPVPCSVWRAWGGGGPVPAPPYLAWGCGGGGTASPGGVPSTVVRGVWGQALPLPRLPAHRGGCWGPRSTCCGRGRAGVGALLCPLGLHALSGLRAAGRVRGVRVPGGGRGGACRAGGRSASFRPSAFLGQATKRVSLVSCCPWGAWPPIPLQFVLIRLLWARSVRRPGRLARARLFSAAPVGAGGWGGGAGRAPAPLSGGGGVGIPPASGGGSRGPCGLRAGGGVGGGGSHRGLPAPLLGGGLRYSILAPLVSSAHSLPACACGRGRSAAPGWGGLRGGPWTAPPGAPADLNPPSALPEWAVVTGGLGGARPPYCSVARVAPARWRGLAPRPRPPREQVQPHPPPPASRSLLGGGASPRLRGGGGPLLWLPSWGRCGGGGGGGAPPPPRPVGRRPAFRCPRRAPPGYTRAVGVAGRPRASGAVRSAADGSVRRGEGGGNPPALVRAPVFPGPASDKAAPFAPSWAPPVRCRSAAGRACGRLPRPWCPRTPGAAPSSGAVWGRRFFGPPLSALRPEWEGGGGSGGGPLVPWRRLLTAGKGGAWRSRPRGPAIGWGVAPFPRPPLPRAGPSCRPSLGPLIPPAVVARRWPAWGGCEG